MELGANKKWDLQNDIEGPCCVAETGAWMNTFGIT